MTFESRRGQTPARFLFRERFVFALKRRVRIEQDRDRPLVDQFDLHHRLKDACRYREPQLAQRFAEFFVEQLRLFWRCCRDEAWPALTARVTIESKLRHDECAALYVQ